MKTAGKWSTNSYWRSIRFSFAHHIWKVFSFRNLKLLIVSASSQAPFVDISAQFTFTLSKIVSLMYLTWSYCLAKQKCQINLFTLSAKALPGRFKQENSGILKTVKTCDQHTHQKLSSLQLNIPRSKKEKYTTKSLRCFKNVALFTNQITNNHERSLIEWPLEETRDLFM